MNELEPGFYVLTKDIDNPAPIDRRKSAWYCQPAIHAGTVFGVRADPEIPGRLELAAFHARGGKQEGAPLTLNPKRRSLRYAPLVGALAPHLEREADTLTSIFWVCHTDARTVLHMLIERGIITMDDVRSTVQKWVTE